MNRFCSRICRLVLAFGSLALASMSHAADPFPSKPIRIVVPSAPGGNLDATARMVAQGLSEVLGQPVIVENRSGSGGLIGTRLVAKSPADGYTLLAISNSFAILPSVYQTLGYDSLRDLTGIGIVGRAPMLVLAPANGAQTNMRDFIAYVRQNPGRLSYASGGTGTVIHLAAAMFLQQHGLNMTHIPYRGNGPALVDAISGQVQMLFDPINTSAQLVRDGKLRALAITSAKRSQQMPEVPTVAELGLPGYEITLYTGLLAPAGTPPEVIAKLHEALNKTTASAEMRERAGRGGTELLSSSKPEEFTQFLAQEIQRYSQAAPLAGVKKE